MDSENNNSNNSGGRKRSLTSIALGWVADRLRRCEELKEQINTGTYEVDNEKIASAIVKD